MGREIPGPVHLEPKTMEFQTLSAYLEQSNDDTVAILLWGWEGTTDVRGDIDTLEQLAGMPFEHQRRVYNAARRKVWAMMDAAALKALRTLY